MITAQIEEFFYSKASARIRDRIKKSKLTYEQIYSYDTKQICRIVNNKRTKNNRFLICDAVLDSHYKVSETEYIPRGLLHVPELHFNNVKEILWGTNEEIDSYLYDLFILLCNEITNNSSYDIDINLLLCDFIPYAECYTYYNILFSPNNQFPALLYGKLEDDIITNLEPTRHNALLFLYKKCENEFKKFFHNFADTQNSFYKLNKKIKEELIVTFISLLNNYQPDTTSLGLRVRDLIISDLSHCAPIIEFGINDSYYSALISASSKYILELKNIQKQNIKI